MKAGILVVVLASLLISGCIEPIDNGPMPVNNTTQTGELTKEQAIQSIVGLEINYTCWGPSSYTVDEKDIKNATKNDSTWALDTGMWVFYVDAQTGRLLEYEQRFIC